MGMLPPEADVTSTELGISIMDCGWGLTILGNSVSGSGGPCIGALSFCIRKEKFANNTLHSGNLGFVVKGDKHFTLGDLVNRGVTDHADAITVSDSA